MNYNTNQSIFIQIAERICDRVLSGNYKADTVFRPYGNWQ